MRRDCVLLGAAPLVLTACGGTAHRVSYVVTGVRVPSAGLTRALRKTAGVPSVHVTIARRISFKSPFPVVSSNCTTTTHTTGDVDNVHHTARFDQPAAPVVVSGTTYYEKNGRQWTETPGAALLGRAFPLSSAGFGTFEPRFLKFVRPHRVTEIGSARIGGAPTTQYRTWIGGDEGVRQPVELWTDHSGRLRQARFAQSPDIVVTVRLSGFGEHLHIVPPKTAVPSTNKMSVKLYGSGKGKACK